MYTDISHLGLLKVGGKDALKFLQGQLTCNVEKASLEPMLGAQCNPQGRVISLFFLLFYKDSYYLVLHKGMVEVTLHALTKYKIFYKVEIKLADDELMLHELLFARMIKCAQQFNENHIPFIYPQTSQKFLAHELNLPELNAIDFNKGCYTGQEIIARMHYKAKRKNALYHFKAAHPITLSPGVDIYADLDLQYVCGSIVDVKSETETLITMNKDYIHQGSYYLADKTPLHLQLVRACA